MHFMLETIIAAHLLGIDAFDQPAVEEGKVLGQALSDRHGVNQSGAKSFNASAPMILA